MIDMKQESNNVTIIELSLEDLSGLRRKAKKTLKKHVCVDLPVADTNGNLIELRISK